jgi:linoleoyl-CoA desaturase
MRFENDSDGGFGNAVRQTMRQYLEANGEHRFADRWLLAEGALLAALFAGAYVAILSGQLPVWGALGCAMVAGVSALLLAINVGHDAAHECFTRWPAVDHAIQRVVFTLLGVDSYLWRFRHAHSHHHFPNVNGCDIDIDQNPFFRLSPNQPMRGYFRWQHLYAPVVYCLVVLHTVFVQDFMYLHQRRIANLRNVRHPWTAHVAFYLSKIAFLTLVLVLPCTMTSLTLSQVIIGYLLVSALLSLLFVFLLIGTHFSDRTEFPSASRDGVIGHSWAAHALITAQDWAPGSRIAAFLTGGANCHAAHHLAPRLSHRHYRQLAPLIKRVADRYGVAYTQASFGRFVASHFRFLRRMAGAPDASAGGRSSAGAPFFMSFFARAGKFFRHPCIGFFSIATSRRGPRFR